MNKTRIIIGLNLPFLTAGLKEGYSIEQQIIEEKIVLFDSIGNPKKTAIFNNIFNDINISKPVEFLKSTQLFFENYSEFYALEYKKRSREETKELLSDLNSKTLIAFAEEDQEVIHFKNIETSNSIKTQNYPYNIINHIPFKSTSPSGKIKVAVLDTGIDYKHPYLKDCLWENPTQKGSYGFNFTIFNNKDKFDVKDENGHGTRVAGIIAANSQNKDLIGITNVAEIMSFKIAPGSDIKTYISDIILAFFIAYKNNVKVYNNSWEIFEYSKALKLVLNFFERNNCILIFGAGNDGCNIKYKFPQNQSNVITVGSVGLDSKQSEFSNWGEEITIWAPGERIFSTGKTNKYNKENVNKESGTSFSAPFVTGTVAILKHNNPKLNVHQIKNLLKRNGTKIELSQTPKFGKLLNINNTININLFKTNKMNEKCKNLIPETHEDVNKCIYTFLHLKESEIFQLLHNETDSDGMNPFQVYGKFRVGESDNEDIYNLEEVDFKLVNFIKNINFRIIAAEFKKPESEDKPIDLNIYIGTVEKQNIGIDLALKQSFSIKKGRIIDIHIKTIPGMIRKNGKPCNVKAH